MTSTRRRVLLALAAATTAVAGLGIAGWAGTGDAPQARTAAAPPTSAQATTVPRPATTAPGLPVPEPSPADPYAATADVVHGTISLPTIGVTQALHEGVTLTAIDRGPSHWPGTALPGQVGNVVVAGHRVTHTRPFYDLDRLAPGDPLVFTLHSGGKFTYTLVSTEVVTPDAMRILDQTPAYTATLFACHPKGSARERFVAHFRLSRPAAPGRA